MNMPQILAYLKAKKTVLGRQPEVAVKTKLRGTLSAKVIRVDGTVEDLGVIGTTE